MHACCNGWSIDEPLSAIDTTVVTRAAHKPSDA